MSSKSYKYGIVVDLNQRSEVYSSSVDYVPDIQIHSIQRETSDLYFLDNQVASSAHRPTETDNRMRDSSAIVDYIGHDRHGNCSITNYTSTGLHDEYRPHEDQREIIQSDRGSEWPPAHLNNNRQVAILGNVASRRVDGGNHRSVDDETPSNDDLYLEIDFNSCMYRIKRYPSCLNKKH